MTVRRGVRALGWLVASTTVGAVAAFAAVSPAQALTVPDRTSRLEARRVDHVEAPTLEWYPCLGGVECATARLPRDYDAPRGATVEVAVVRSKARDQKHRLGSLFVNPGGPGGSGTELAAAAAQVFSPAVLDRFDVVGFDPRGTNSSDQVRCYTGPREQEAVLSALSVPFPYGAKEEASYVAASTALARACSRTGAPLSASVSTAEVARDMDVLRRSVGDKKLTYLGFSYGTYLGQVYANMFPDRVRAVAIDGVVDPVAWAGTAATQDQPQTDRLGSADGAWRALHEILVRCQRAGTTRCEFAGGDPVAKLAELAARLRARPYSETDPDTGETFTFGYADLVGFVLSSLYDPDGWQLVDLVLTDFYELTGPRPTRPSASATEARAAVARSARTLVRDARTSGGTAHSYGFPYDNSLDAFTSVLCTDSVNPARAEAWPAAAAAADRRAPYFGRAWIWSSAACASSTWTARDEDHYRGPFTRTTAAPLLVVGGYWDPATSYAGAVHAARLAPSSRLLSNDSWGHTSYGTSVCATDAVDRYLLRGALPAVGTVCKGDSQPFQDDPEEGVARRTTPTRTPVPVDGLRPLPDHVPGR